MGIGKGWSWVNASGRLPNVADFVINSPFGVECHDRGKVILFDCWLVGCQHRCGISAEALLLVEKFNTALQNVADVTRDPHLANLGSALAVVDAEIHTISELKSYATALDNLMGQPGFGFSGSLTEIFAQTLGEAHFLVMCHEKGIALRRIPEEKSKTPDFKAVFGNNDVFFEVKTPSVVNGAFGITEAQESSLEANIDIELQLKRGARIAIGISEAHPYSNKLEYDKTILSVVNTLLEKTRNNIKADQFANPNTFLVLNLSVIPPLVTEPKALCPIYPEADMFPKSVTGELWMVAFGNKGMLILGTPEFEGKPCVQGVFEKVGVLVDSEYASVAGIIFMVHRLDSPAQLFGLFRSNDWTSWQACKPELLENLQILVGKNWNDCLNSNGWQLVGD